MPRSPMLMGAAAGYLLLSLAWVKLPLWGGGGVSISPSALPIDPHRFRQDLSVDPAPGCIVGGRRLPDCDAAADFRNSPAAHRAMRSRSWAACAAPVFVAGTILSMAAQAWRHVHGSGFATDIINHRGRNLAVSSPLPTISTGIDGFAQSPPATVRRFRRNRSTACRRWAPWQCRCETLRKPVAPATRHDWPLDPAPYPRTSPKAALGRSNPFCSRMKSQPRASR